MEWLDPLKIARFIWLVLTGGCRGSRRAQQTFATAALAGLIWYAFIKPNSLLHQWSDMQSDVAAVKRVTMGDDGDSLTSYKTRTNKHLASIDDDVDKLQSDLSGIHSDIRHLDDTTVKIRSR